MKVRQSSPSIPDNLRQALAQIVTHPVDTLVPPWSWKAAAFGAVLRSAAFFSTNFRAGPRAATKATLVEAAFAVIAAGLIGAISQQLRKAEPLWATALVVWVGLPALMVLTQLGVHRLAHTPHLTGGLVISFLLAAVSSAFSWYAMRQGAMLGGVDETTVSHDIQSLPGISLDFLFVVPRLVMAKLQQRIRGN